MIHLKPLLEPEFHLKLQELSTLASNQEIRLKTDPATKTNELVVREFGPIAGLKEAGYALGRFFQMGQESSDEVRISSDVAASVMHQFLEMHQLFITSDDLAALAKLSCYFKLLDASNATIQKTVAKIQSHLKAQNPFFITPTEIFNHILGFLPNSAQYQSILALRGSCSLLRDKFSLESLPLSDACQGKPKAVRSFGRMLSTLLQNDQNELAGKFFSKFFKESSLLAKGRFLRFFINGGRIEHLHELLDLKGNEIEELSFVKCDLPKKGVVEELFSESASTIIEILKIIAKCSKLTSLNLDTVAIRSREEEDFFSHIIKSLTSLQKLELSNMSARESILSLLYLKSLKIRNSDLLMNYVHCNKLDELIIPDCAITPNKLNELLSLNTLKKLEIAYVSGLVIENQIPSTKLSEITHCAFRLNNKNFFSYLKLCKNLEVLKVEGIVAPEGKPIYPKPVDEFPELPKLKRLSLGCYPSSNAPCLNDWHVNDLDKIVPKYASSLTQLHIHNLSLCFENDIDKFALFCQKYSQIIQTIEIALICFADNAGSVLEMVPILTSLPKLETLKITFGYTNLLSFPEVSSVSRLENLSLIVYNMSPEALKGLATYHLLESISLKTHCTHDVALMLSQLSNLQKCSLTNWFSGDQSMFDNSLRCLLTLSRLRNLYLNGFTWSTSAHFLELFQKIPDLESLSCIDCSGLRTRKDKIEPEFVEMLGKMKNLSHLNIHERDKLYLNINPELFSVIGEDLLGDF